MAIFLSQTQSTDSAEEPRKVAAASGIITTVAGSGFERFTGDGGPATAAGLSFPEGVVLDSAGNLYIADSTNHLVRRVAAGSGIITTVAGNGVNASHGDGGPATEAGLSYPANVALDFAGNLYIADYGLNRVLRVDAESGIITTVAGNGSVGGSGDGGAAPAAQLFLPQGVAVDSAGNLYIADTFNDRIRKVAAGSEIITTVAGNGSEGFSDGGAATAAQLFGPRDVTVDSVGNLYIADFYNHRIRKVASASGIITTVAGNGSAGFSGDGGAATAAQLSFPDDVALDREGSLYIADTLNARIRKVAAGSGFITTIAGNGSQGFGGDGGAATTAGLAAAGVAVDPLGNVYIAGSNRVRIVFACITVPSPVLEQPSNASISVPSSPRLAWSAAKGAFHYDVYLDTANPPQKVVAADITASTYSPANLEPLTQYYWKVVAKGDPFCTPFSSARSDVFSFTTAGTCAAPGPLSGAVSTSGEAAPDEQIVSGYNITPGR